MTQKPIQHERDDPKAIKFSNEIHFNVWGPAPIKTRGGNEYYVSFMDDHTRFMKTYLMKSKDEVIDYYEKFQA
jgi:hypothetical protein